MAGCTKCGCGPDSCRCERRTCSCPAGKCNCPSEGKAHQITAEELKEKMAQKPDMLVVNVLAKDYYDDCHLRGSINVPLNELKEKAATWAKDRKIVVYCASYECTASKEAVKLLISLGFTKVCAYEGGTKEWKEKGFPIDGACVKDYLK